MMCNKPVKLLLLLLSLLIPCAVSAQSGIVEMPQTISVLLDSSDVRTVVFWFPSTIISVEPDSDVVGTISHPVRYDAKAMVTVDLDSLVGSAEVDSFLAYGWAIDNNGFRVSDTLKFDWTAHDTTDTLQYLAWTPANRGTQTAHTGYVHITTLPDVAHGLELRLEQAAADSNGTGSGIRSQATVGVATRY